MMPDLRDYQIECLDAIKANLDRNVVACLPTGSGKSHVIAELCRWALSEYPGTRVVILAHVRELLEQNADKMRRAWPDAPIGIYCAGLNQKVVNSITVASIQSIFRQTEETGHYDLIIIDEAHRIPPEHETMYQRFIINQRRLYEHVKVIGLTATPYRLKSGLLHEGADAIFDDLVYNAPFGELVHKGWLSPIVPVRGTREVDTSQLHVIAGEFKADEMEAAFSDQLVNDAVVNDILTHAVDRQSILVFSAGVNHAYILKTAFERRSITAEVVTGETHSDNRSARIDRFKSGSLRVLINCNVLTTGFDAPNADCIALVRATKSPGLYVQILGRGSRTSPGKKNCLILDYGQNVRRHGVIDGVLDRVKNKRPEGTEKRPLTKTCPSCRMECPLAAKVCENCGFVWPAQEREINIDIHTDDADPMQPKTRTMAVEFISCRPHEKNGRISARVIYHLAGDTMRDRITVSEYLCFDHSDGARWHAEKWVRKNVNRDHDYDYFSVDGMVDFGYNDIAWPTTVTVTPEGKFWRIIHKDFS